MPEKFFFSATCKEKNMDLRCVVDKACWMCGPQASSHLDHWVNWGQGERVEVDSNITARGRVRLLKRIVHKDVWLTNHSSHEHVILTMIFVNGWKINFTQSVVKVVVNHSELMIYWSSKCLDRQKKEVLWPYYVTSRGGERACRGWWWMVLRAGEEDWRGWGGVSTQRGGSVSLIFHRNQHQLGKVLFTGLYIYDQTIMQINK